MPRGDGTGPEGKGPGTGRSMGRGGARGRKGGISAGPGSYCTCPQCGAKASHQSGVPCYDQQCPQCGTAMVRE